MESTGSIILSAVLIASIVAPFWFIMRSVHRREKRLEKALKAAQEKYGLNFDENHEVWGEKIIGVDPRQRWFAFLNVSEKSPSEALIDLSKVDQVKIQRKTTNENGKVVINQVDLQFRISYEVEKWTTVTIFDITFDDLMEGGFHGEVAKKWVAEIESVLAGNSRKRKASPI